jgi:hypothetical protein
MPGSMAWALAREGVFAIVIITE